MSYTFRGRTPRILKGGRPIARGETVSDRVAGENPHLVESGLLVKPAEPKSASRGRGAKGAKTTDASGNKETTSGSEKTGASDAAAEAKEA